jgi:hypothetical protein
MFSTQELVLKTADLLEKRPQCYRYTCNRIPLSSYGSGCLLGWMAYYSGERRCAELTPDIIARITCDPVSACDVGYSDFFKRLDECYPLYRGPWRSNVMDAVAALRAYAARYPQSPGLPAWAQMRDREALAARQCYAQFRSSLDLRPLPERALEHEELPPG